jgi:peroxiredoxin
MKWLLTALLLSTTSIKSFSVIEIGEMVPDRCWKALDVQEVCLSNLQDRVRVLIFSAGWCPECNQEFQRLVPRLHEIANLPVDLISLSAAGWKKTSPPDQTFLKQWKDSHQIPFAVAASPKDAGQEFFEQVYIPNFVVLDKKGRLAYKYAGSDIDRLFATVRKLAAE